MNAVKKEFKEKTKDSRNIIEDQLVELRKRKVGLEEERKSYRKKAPIMGYSFEEIKETTEEYDTNISLLDSEIAEVSQSTHMDKYLERIPEILCSTFELANSTLTEAEKGEKKENLLKLLELTTFELTVNDKKELKVKLFDVLDRLVSDDKSLLEAPPGVEPGYGALQAPA